jgi:hypothetical protein
VNAGLPCLFPEPLKSRLMGLITLGRRRFVVDHRGAVLSGGSVTGRPPVGAMNHHDNTKSVAAIASKALTTCARSVITASSRIARNPYGLRMRIRPTRSRRCSRWNRRSGGRASAWRSLCAFRYPSAWRLIPNRGRCLLLNPVRISSTRHVASGCPSFLAASSAWLDAATPLAACADPAPSVPGRAIPRQPPQ